MCEKDRCKRTAFNTQKEEKRERRKEGEASRRRCEETEGAGSKAYSEGLFEVVVLLQEHSKVEDDLRVCNTEFQDAVVHCLCGLFGVKERRKKRKGYRGRKERASESVNEFTRNLDRE